MKLLLESNFMLLGNRDIDSIEFETDGVTLKMVLEKIASLSSNSPEFLNREGTELAIGWNIEINGRSLDLYNDGVNTLLKDGDRVLIRLDLLGGG
ncbi:MAG: hypothetical protein N2745_10780 [Syntrophorhabdaceae bacterium]|nr:hypothetical protein [Syntrophorhabdaceae bacterium]